MASNYTENYGLCQWEATDQVLRTEFNEDNAKVDAALVKHDNALVENTQAIQAEADARASEVSCLNSQIGRKGNCKIEFQSYIGNGQCGQDHPISISFSARPAIFYIGAGDNSGVGYYVQGCNILWVRPGNSTYSCNGRWSGNTFSWWHTYVDFQLNRLNTTYAVVALIPL